MSTRPPNGPREVFVPAEVPLRALWWGEAGDITAPSRHGSRSTIVLLHGLGDGADIWRSMVAAWPSMHPGLPILALDLPGHGESRYLAAGRYRLEEVAAIVSATLARLSITHPVLIGHSFGARVALALGARALARPQATILIDTSPEANERADAAVAEHIDALIAGAADLEGLIESVHARLPLGQSEAVREAITAMARATARGWQVPLDPAIKALLHSCDKDGDDWGLLKAVAGPVGIVRGAYSSFLTRAMAARMAAATPMPAAVETIERAGHAIALEQPAALADTLGRLVTRLAHGR